jgi:hypothetical protein
VKVGPPPPPESCGDGIVQSTEDCDGSAFNAATCQSLGFDTGTLACTADCHFSTVACVKRCGNGVLDPLEACDGALGLPTCAAWGYQACSATCTVDSLHCVSTAFEAAPQLDVTHGGPTVIGTLAATHTGALVMAEPGFGRLQLFPWNQVSGFDATAVRTLAFQRTPQVAAVCDVDGDGNDDFAAIDADGTVDEYVFSGTSYSLRSADAGVPGGQFVGSGYFGRGTNTRDVMIAGPGRFVLVGNATVRTLAAPDAGAATLVDLERDGLVDLAWVDSAGGLHRLAAPGFADDGGAPSLGVVPTAIAMGDLDGDGDADLAAVVGDQVQLFENIGAAGFAPHGTFTAVGATQVFVQDLDLDGQPDVVFATGADVLVRHNRGQWTFTELALNLGIGPRLSVSIGDVDGDGDLDVVATVSTGADATRTTVARNRVR